MELGLKGKVAAISGGTQGIGKATALLLAREGVKVAICARDTQRIAETVAEIEAAGGAAIGIQADVTQVPALERFVKAIIDKWGRLDILINNAGTRAAHSFLELDDAAWQEDIDLKLFAAIRLSRLAIPHMKKQGGGRIINLTAIAGKQPRANSVPTSVTRAAGLALTKALSKDLAPDNILVNTVCIGRVKAGQHEYHRERIGKTLEQHYADAGKNIPLGRVGEAEEVANVIAFLASDAASYVTGTSINLDGGVSGVL